MSKWQPIETAPKDGTQILIWDGNVRIVAEWGDVPGDLRMGWWATNKSYLDSPYEPTHWAPIPEPPND